MNNNNSSLVYFSKPVNRVDFVSLLKTAQSIGDYRFSRQASLAWLANFPGDMLVSFILAESMVGEGKYAQAIPALEKLIMLDPEFDEVYAVLELAKESIAKVDPAGKNKKGIPSLHSARASMKASSEWRLHLHASQKAIRDGQFEQAEKHAQKALLANPSSPIPAIHQIKLAYTQKDFQSVHNLAELYHQRWGDCLQFCLFLAESYLKLGDETQAVSLLHHCVTRDSAGQVPNRIWGLNHEYQALWPDRLEILFDLPIPANVSAVMGWNALRSGDASFDARSSYSSYSSSASPTPVDSTISSQNQNTLSYVSSGSGNGNGQHPNLGGKQFDEKALEEFKAIQSEFDKLAKKVMKSTVSQTDGRFPNYVILTTHKGLVSQYGDKTAEIIDEQLKKLVSEIRKRPGWNSTLYSPDDPTCTATFGLKPIAAIDPWKIKLSITDLDRSLAKKGERIGALLIVGGPTVVPFHHLPNPTDDGDPDVPSDNPYATSDENYFVPEWPLGRLPGEGGTDAGLLLERLRNLTLTYAQLAGKNTSKNIFSSMSRSIRAALSRITNNFKHRKIRFSFGYSAQVWREASAEVYKVIGQPKSLLTTPPLSSGCALNSKLVPVKLAYFNLHGIQDAVEWYGQKCSDGDSTTPDYPVALSPKDIQDLNGAPVIVFSEACYGAYLKDQKTDECMALKFLSSGTQAMVGSTSISYGSVAKPVIAADLLAQGFWEQLREGQTVGNALRRAKINLAREMSKRQGYLDGEDQKTLLSFVLYGDPLMSVEIGASQSKTILRSRTHPILKTVTDRRDETVNADQLSPIMMSKVKDTVNQYLPGMQDAKLGLDLQSCTCNNESTQCNSCKISAKGPAFRNQKRVVVTLTKEVKGYKGLHHVYARMTLDPNGKVLKVSASR